MYIFAVLGHVVKNGIKLSGLSTNMELNSEFRETINYMLDIAKKQAISDREKKHVSAVALWAEGYFNINLINVSLPVNKYCLVGIISPIRYMMQGMLEILIK